MTFDSTVLAAIVPLRDAGFALHWLRERSKAPVESGWSEAAVASLGDLKSSHRRGNNLGVRLGEPSVVAGGYLHAIDMDVRVPDIADEAWDALRAMLPGVDLDDLPCVQSGSGGESRHFYLILDKPFRSKRLWVSAGKHRGSDGKWHFDAELELFGTGKQTALPPSIHPDTGKPYVWLREFDFDMLDLGIGPFVASADIEKLAVAEHATYEYESREPLTFTTDQLNRTLNAIEVSDLHYDDWIRLGQALHHQTGGSDAGFDLWLTQTKRSSKFTGEKQVREMRRVKWKSFGRYRGAPVTMATIVEWAKDARIADLRASFDEEDEGEDDQSGNSDDVVELPVAAKRAGVNRPGQIASSAFDDILGGGGGSADAADADPIDAICRASGGSTAADSDDDAGPDVSADDDEIDEIDAIGSNVPVKGQSREVSGDWISLLDINDEGAIKPTLHNVELIVCNDPRLVGLPQLNEFTQEVVQRTAPGTKANRRRNAAKQTRQLEGRVWNVKDTLNGEMWSDDRDFAIRSILEAPGTQGGYGLKITDRDLKAAVSMAAQRSAFHPVREYLDGLVWDGTARAETLFHDYVGAPDNCYTRDVSRLMLLGAVTRIYEPGHKFDFAVILEGMQGRRKSTFIQTLGKSWFGELSGSFDDHKQMIELMQSKWIMEIPELSGFGRVDVRAIKAFISTQSDRARLAYARRAGDFPRQCVFVGSTNDREYLKDDTGGRRFWPMLCLAESINIDRLKQNIDQVWAEVVTIYQTMRVEQPYEDLPLYLVNPESASIAARLQESRRVESADDGIAGQVAEWLSRPIVSGSMDDDFDAAGGPRFRDKTCLVDIWYNCLGNTGKYMTADGNMLARVMNKIPDWTSDGSQHRFDKWGKQRLYWRIEAGKRSAE